MTEEEVGLVMEENAASSKIRDLAVISSESTNGVDYAAGE